MFASSRLPSPAAVLVVLAFVGVDLGFPEVMQPFRQALKGFVRRWVPPGHGPVLMLVFVASWIVTKWIGVALHELGHLVGGALRRMRFHRVVIGRLYIGRVGPNLRVLWRPRSLGSAGRCSMTPTRPGRERVDMTWCILGGPLASLLVVFASYAAARAIGPQSEWQPAALRLFFGVSVLASGLMFTLSVVPAAYRGVTMSDGLYIKRLWADPEAAQGIIAMMTIGSLSMDGVRPRDWPRDLVEQLDRGGTKVNALQKLSVEVAIATDEGRFGQALRMNQQLLEEVDDGLEGTIALLKLERAILMGLSQGDPVEARACYEAGKGALLDAHRVSFAEACVLELEGELDAAREVLERSAREWKHSSELVSEMDRERHQLLLDRVNGAQTALGRKLPGR